MKGRWWLLAGCLGVYLLLSSTVNDFLPQARDITQTKLVRTLALDKGEEEGYIKLTASGTVSPGSDGGESQPPMILNAEAQTILMGTMDLQRQSDGYVEFGHMTECVIGEDLAKEGIQGVIDFVERDYSTRLDTDFYILSGGTAQEAAEGLASKQTDLPERLEAISQDETYGGHEWNYTLRKIISQLEDNGSALIPALELEDNPDYNPDQPKEAPEKSVKLSGLAFLKDYKLGGVLTEEESRGTAVILDQDQLDVLEFTMENGAVVGIQLVYARCTLKPVFDREGKLTELTVVVKMKGDLNEIRGWADPLNDTELKEMEARCCKELEALCTAALDRSWQEGVDFLHLRRRLEAQCPLKAVSLGENWESWFPEMEYKVRVEGDVERSYDVNRPMEEKDSG